MKTLIKKTILAFAMIIALVANANDGISFIKKDGKIKTALKIDNVKPGQLLSIIDMNGLVMYKEHIKISGVYNKYFDLTALPDGKYYFEIDKEIAITTIPFNVKYNTVAFNKDKETTIYKPVVRIKNNSVYVSRLSLEYAPLEVNIYYQDEDSNYNLIHTETVEKTKIFNRIYTLDSQVKGNYKLVFKTKDKLFVEKVKL